MSSVKGESRLNLFYQFRFRALLILLVIRICSVSPAMADSGTRLEFSVPNALLGSIFTNLHFRWTDHFSVGPTFGFHPLYLLEGTSGGVWAFDLGLDTLYNFKGDTESSSWYINPFTYYSIFTGLRVEEPAIRVGVNVGYRWVFDDGCSLTLGVGAQSRYTSMTAYYMTSRGRVEAGTSRAFIPIEPAFRISFGIPL